MPLSPRVTLLLSAGRDASEITSWLERAGMEIVPFPEGPSTEPLPDVLVTDQEESILAAHHLLPHKREDLGIVSFFPCARGDAVLPEDATPREVELVCRLVAEILQLRREIRRDRGSLRQLRRLAHLDVVSKLPNRRGWERELTARFVSPSRAHVSLSLAIFDLDDFKAINDTLGHPAGDLVLKEVGQAITRSVRPEDFCARVGGDEFGLIISGLDSEQSLRIVERVRMEIGLAAAGVAGRPISISAGLAHVPPREGDPESLYRRADNALLLAKSAGRAQTRLAETP